MSLINGPRDDARARQQVATPPLPGEGDIAWLAQFEDTFYAVRWSDDMDVGQGWFYRTGDHAWTRMYMC